MPARTSLKPRMLFSGVRSSWLMVARKSLLSGFISYSRMFTCASSSTLPSRFTLACRSSSWMVISVRNMRLKAVESSSNSSPVWISARKAMLPRVTASLTSRRCRRGLTIT